MWTEQPSVGPPFAVIDRRFGQIFVHTRSPVRPPYTSSPIVSRVKYIREAVAKQLRLIGIVGMCTAMFAGLVLVAVAPAQALPGQGFCAEGSKLLIGQLGEEQGGTQLYEAQFEPNGVSMAAVGDPQLPYNAMALNPDDGSLYAIGAGGDVEEQLLRINPDGTVARLGSVERSNVAAFDDRGRYWFGADQSRRLWMLDDLTAERLEPVELELDGSIVGSDITFADGYMWSAADADGHLHRIDLDTGEVVDFGAIIGADGEPIGGRVFGGAFTYGSGHGETADLGFMSQQDGLLYRVQRPGSDDENPSVVSTQALQTPSSNGDAAACLTAEAALALTKTAPATVRSDQQFTYTITVTNKADTTSSGWSLADVIPANVENPTTSTDGCEITGGTLTCTGGALSPGDSATVRLKVRAPHAEFLVDAPPVTVTNHAEVRGNEGDRYWPDNKARATTLVLPALVETETEVVSSRNPSVVGDGVTFTATVTTPEGEAPSGAVGFTVGGEPLCTDVQLDEAGQATCDATFDAAGERDIAATYVEQDGFGGSEGGLVQDVIKAATTTTLSADPNPSQEGDAVDLTAVVEPAADDIDTDPTGRVEFFVDGDDSLGTAALGSPATLTITDLTAGEYEVIAVYGGDDMFTTSTSDPLTLTVIGPSADDLPDTGAKQVGVLAAVGAGLLLAGGVLITRLRRS